MPEGKVIAGIEILRLLHSLDAETRRTALAQLPEIEREALDREWRVWAHDGQVEPPGEWDTWVIKGGRGFGKTRAGAQWIESLVARHPDVPLRIALVGATIDDARRVMVEGPSGLIEVAGHWVTEWHPALGRLRFRSGAEATLFSGANPHLLRGPEHHYAWCDELAKWKKPEESWDMLQLGLRAGAKPRAVITTTPRPGPVLKAIIDDPATKVTGGPTRANPHLARAWHERIHRLYAGTRLGRQELDGELLPDVAGALWTVELLERCRVPPRNGEGDRPQGGGGAQAAIPASETSGSAGGAPPPCFAWSPSPGGGGIRTLIAVDPPSGGGTCGIIACAREGSGDSAIAHVLADHSVTGRSPEGWTSAVAAAAQAHGTIEVVAEQNQGGKMVKAVLHAADPRLRVRLVSAHTGKSARAEPVAHLFEAGRAVLHGRMPELEAQLLGMIAGGGYEGPGNSPDRADAMVWGVTELMQARADPRVRGL
jgi:phage terminase large subunit-like protein